MKELIKLEWPTYRPEQGGACFVKPLNRLSAKGYVWSWDAVFKLKRTIIKGHGSTYVLKSWGDPKVETDHRPITDDYGNLCKCNECVQGRKEVENGWKPSNE